jgi:serine/threonine protein kinase
MNIVRYIEHIRKGKELSIVMEYVENGSLSTMVKNYGRFPESLAKTYIRKVLLGLVYLHDQGMWEEKRGAYKKKGVMALSFSFFCFVCFYSRCDSS